MKQSNKDKKKYKEFDNWRKTFKTKEDADKQLKTCENYSWNPCFVSKVTTQGNSFFKIFQHETDQNRYLKKLNDEKAKHKNYYTKHYYQKMAKDKKRLKLYVIILAILLVPTILYGFLGNAGLGYTHIGYLITLFTFISIMSIILILVQIPLPNFDPPNAPLTLASVSHFIIPAWISLVTFYFTQSILISFLVPFFCELFVETIEYIGYLYIDWIRKMTEEAWINRIFDVVMAVLGILLALLLVA